jgi:hypothetical protein
MNASTFKIVFLFVYLEILVFVTNPNFFDKTLHILNLIGLIKNFEILFLR